MLKELSSPSAYKSCLCVLQPDKCQQASKRNRMGKRYHRWWTHDKVESNSLTEKKQPNFFKRP